MRGLRFAIPVTAVVVFLSSASPVLAGAQATSSQDDVLTSQQVRELVAAANTPEQHATLARHFKALGARYDADAGEHRALAALYRKAPTASETKRPMAPDTAAHCERFAKRAADAAAEARKLAGVHERLTTPR